MVVFKGTYTGVKKPGQQARGGPNVFYWVEVKTLACPGPVCDAFGKSAFLIPPSIRQITFLCIMIVLPSGTAIAKPAMPENDQEQNTTPPIYPPYN